MTHNKLMFLFISGLLSACASNNRSNYVTSIGTEDLTQKKPVNVIIYQDRNLEARENKEVFNRAANEISSTLKQLSDKNRIRLNNTAFYSGDWFDVERCRKNWRWEPGASFNLSSSSFSGNAIFSSEFPSNALAIRSNVSMRAPFSRS